MSSVRNSNFDGGESPYETPAGSKPSTPPSTPKSKIQWGAGGATDRSDRGRTAETAGTTEAVESSSSSISEGSSSSSTPRPSPKSKAIRGSSTGGIPVAAGVQLGQKAMEERQSRGSSPGPGRPPGYRRPPRPNRNNREAVTAYNTEQNIGRGVIPLHLINEPHIRNPPNITDYDLPPPFVRAGLDTKTIDDAIANAVPRPRVRIVGMRPRRARRATETEGEALRAKEHRRDSAMPGGHRRSLSETVSDTVKSVKRKVSKSLPKSSADD